MATNVRLKTARVAQSMTQFQLAERIGRKEIEVSRYETGRAVPDAQTKEAIAKTLGKPSYELFDR